VTFKEWLVVTFPGLIEQLGKPEIIAYLDSIEGQMLREIGAKSWDEVKATDERVVDFLMEQVVKLYEEDYEEYPVDPETFLHDPYYLGYNCNRERGITRLWPKLEETFYEVFDPSKGISEVILSGSIGWGKTHFASVCFAYMLYKLSCLKHPQTYYNLAPGSEVVLLNLSVTGDQAVGVFFAYVRNLILGPEGQAGSPYFMENFRPVNKADNPMIFPKNIRLVAGNSQETAAIGQNVVAGFIDEANFMVSTRASKHEKAGAKGGEDVNRGLVLYRAMDRRIKSRFKDTDKDYPGKLFMASSVTYPGDFLSDMIDKKRNDPAPRSWSTPTGTRARRTSSPTATSESSLVMRRRTRSSSTMTSRIPRSRRSLALNSSGSPTSTDLTSSRISTARFGTSPGSRPSPSCPSCRLAPRSVKPCSLAWTSTIWSIPSP
jgi:hypothetical protein